MKRLDTNLRGRSESDRHTGKGFFFNLDETITQAAFSLIEKKMIKRKLIRDTSRATALRPSFTHRIPGLNVISWLIFVERCN